MSDIEGQIIEFAVAAIILVIFGLVLISLAGADPSAYTGLVETVVSIILQITVVAIVGVVILKIISELVP